jgi:hypothetical protein
VVGTVLLLTLWLEAALQTLEAVAVAVVLVVVVALAVMAVAGLLLSVP